MQKKMLLTIAAFFLLVFVNTTLLSININKIDRTTDQPLEQKPLVSIIIPTYNHYEYTDQCLRSIEQCSATVPYEVIVVDDCSTDNTWNELAKNTTIVAIHNEKNVGFIGTCNRGAAQAKGKYLIFLNNDTEVCTGWIEALLNAFSNHRNVGLVGAKLIYPTGQLQEAGSILYRDASCQRYGWMQDPHDSRFNYVREVDYISGAAIMIKNALFKKLKGLDTYFAPAYFDDTDLAQRVRRAGLHVLYQPDAVVKHYESISMTGTKDKLEKNNHKKFLSRWKTTIATNPTHDIPIDICCDHRCAYRIFIIDSCNYSDLSNVDSEKNIKSKLKSLRSFVKNNCKIYYFPLGKKFSDEYIHN